MIILSLIWLIAHPFCFHVLIGWILQKFPDEFEQQVDDDIIVCILMGIFVKITNDQLLITNYCQIFK